MSNIEEDENFFDNLETQEIKEEYRDLLKYAEQASWSVPSKTAFELGSSVHNLTHTVGHIGKQVFSLGVSMDSFPDRPPEKFKDLLDDLMIAAVDVARDASLATSISSGSLTDALMRELEARQIPYSTYVNEIKPFINPVSDPDEMGKLPAPIGDQTVVEAASSMVTPLDNTPEEFSKTFLGVMQTTARILAEECDN